MPTIKEIINDADYLLDTQKKLLVDELSGEEKDMVVVDLRNMIFDFLEAVIGIKEKDLSAADMTKIDVWLAKEER